MYILEKILEMAEMYCLACGYECDMKRWGYATVDMVKWFNSVCGYEVPFSLKRALTVCRKQRNKFVGEDAGIHVQEALEKHMKECDPDGVYQRPVSEFFDRISLSSMLSSGQR